ncbi:MAG TPA: monovalent cation/H+ antiporter complex subunit F [Longimicrobiales bacterium]|nr:monovalent cation/H+ antiporter complex subunit F [Longimicrobiales bacterium]
MSGFLTGLAVFLVLTLGAGLVRVVRGPTPADRMVAAQLFGTTGTAILLVLSRAMQAPALADVALVFVLLAAVVSVAFVKPGWIRSSGSDSDEPSTRGG